MENDKTPALHNDQNNNESQSKSGFSKFIDWIKKHPLLFTIALSILIIVGLYGYMTLKIDRINNRHNQRIEHITDSLKVEHMKYNVRVFSWAVRSELIRGNLEQVDQFFTEYLKIDGIVKVQLINPETNIITTSTDRKDNGVLVTDQEIVNANSIALIPKGETYLLVNPVMGLDRKLGILVVEISK